MPIEAFERLGVALAIGLLVGVERGWHSRDAEDGQRTAGIRTYTLSGLLGGVAGLIGQSLGPWAFAAVAVPFAAAFTLFKHREQQADQDFSVTAVVAALLVFALGAYAIVGEWRVAAAAGVVTAALLAFKRMLHGWIEKLTWPELRGALILLAMSFVALPALPDRDFGPYGVFNPYQLWLLTIAMAGVSFVAYAAIKMFGASLGALLASAAGAMVSSTAVTLYLAKLERKSASEAVAHAGGALVAGAVMAARIAVIVAVLAPGLLTRVGAPLGIFAAVSAVIGLVAVWRAKDQARGEAGAAMKSPFDLMLIFKFALLLGAFTAAAKALTALFGAKGLLLVAAVAGLADVDAITLSVSRMAGQGLDPAVGAGAILLAAAVDSVSKSAIATVAGGVRFGGLYATGTAIAAAPAVAAFLWTA